MDLEDELYNLSIGDSMVMAYCTKIKAIVDILSKIGYPVSERNLVIYVINGLSWKFAHVVTTIKHQKPIPMFLEMRSILTLDELVMLKEQTHVVQPVHQDHSSVLPILNITHAKSPFKSKIRIL